ncbi:MAG: KH domain-containing protein [Verrucomicrobiales bacterium]|nr:KH domain-containing protein [Verrucomicrobiales bacterium]
MDAPEALLEFLSYVVAQLIENPQQASIAIGTNANGAVVYRVQLAPDDVRRVIGKNGQTVSSIRALMAVAAQRHGVKISLKVGAARDLEAEETPEEERAREEAAARDAEV